MFLHSNRCANSPRFADNFTAAHIENACHIDCAAIVFAACGDVIADFAAAHIQRTTVQEHDAQNRATVSQYRAVFDGYRSADYTYQRVSVVAYIIFIAVDDDVFQNERCACGQYKQSFRAYCARKSARKRSRGLVAAAYGECRRAAVCVGGYSQRLRQCKICGNVDDFIRRRRVEVAYLRLQVCKIADGYGLRARKAP